MLALRRALLPLSLPSAPARARCAPLRALPKASPLAQGLQRPSFASSPSSYRRGLRVFATMPDGRKGTKRRMDAAQTAMPCPTPSVFWMGLDTLRIPMTMHTEIRANLVEGMKEKGAAAGWVLLEGGREESYYDTDAEPVFRQESFFSYLFGVTEPDCWGGIDLSTGECTIFFPRLPEAHAVWRGKIHPLEHFKAKYGCEHVAWADEVPSVVGDAKVYALAGLNTDSGNRYEPPDFKVMGDFPWDVDTAALHPVLVECRVHKTAQEVEVLRYTNKISSRAHVEVMRAVKPGMKEYQLESLFQHLCYSQGGMRHVSYTCICATGPNGAALHYGHAGAPNDRSLEAGDMALFDMGAQYHCYASDITCSFPVTGTFSEDQKVVYEAVLRAMTEVEAAMKPGVSWPNMHRLAERCILEGLKGGGFLTGDVGEMMEAHLGATFMPHGLGHLMGLDTHDVGGYNEGCPPRPVEPGLSKLRTARVLEEGMCITVEPGCYFIDINLDAALADPAMAKFFNKPAIDRMRGFGGIRLEDDVIVAAAGIEVLTKVPRAVEDVEAVMAGAKWPRE